VALVSDAGMPAISDPGEDLVRQAIASQITVIPVPGPNAALSALVASGLPTGAFLFIGFLPREKKRMSEVLSRIKTYPETLIFHESPHRVRETLGRMSAALGNRRAVLARELTKKFESFQRGNLRSLYAELENQTLKGECTIVVEGCGEPDHVSQNQEWWAALSLEAHVNHYLEQGLANKEAIKRVAAERGLPKRDVYRQYHLGT